MWSPVEIMLKYSILVLQSRISITTSITYYNIRKIMELKFITTPWVNTKFHINPVRNMAECSQKHILPDRDRVLWFPHLLPSYIHSFTPFWAVCTNLLSWSHECPHSCMGGGWPECIVVAPHISCSTDSIYEILREAKLRI